MLVISRLVGIMDLHPNFDAFVLCPRLAGTPRVEVKSGGRIQKGEKALFFIGLKVLEHPSFCIAA